MTPVFLDIVLDNAVNVVFLCQKPSMSTPSNFVNFTRSSAILSRITFKSSRAFVDVMWGIGLPNIINFVLLEFIDSLLALNQLFSSLILTIFILLFLLFISLCEYKIKSRIFDVYVISLTYKSSWPSMEPYGTPQMIFSGFKVQLSNATHWVLLER